MSSRPGRQPARSIDSGTLQFGVVAISPNFLNKEWPQKELDGLVAREVDGAKVGSSRLAQHLSR